MPDVQVFRNDGEAMFADDSRRLEYLDPGVVLLYADTEAGVVCSYFEGRLGQPVQGTVECTFADGIDLPRVRPGLEDVDASGFSVSSAPGDDPMSARWALDALTEEPIRLADPERNAVRRLVETDDRGRDGRAWLPSLPPQASGRSLGDLVDDLVLVGADTAGDGDPQTAGHADPEPDAGGDATDDDGAVRADDSRAPAGAALDFETRSTYDAARFFAFLVDALADTGLTVAVSKAGRVDAIANADVVIRPGADLPTGSRVEPLPDTRERLDVQRTAVARDRAREHLADPVAAVGDAYRDATAEEAVDDETGETVLRELLDERLDEHSSLAVVDRWRARYRRVRVAVLAALAGVLVGVLGAKPMRVAARRAAAVARRVAATDLTAVRAPFVDAATGAGHLADLMVPVAAALVLAAAAIVRRRRRRRTGHGLGGATRPSTARSDVVRLALATVAVGALLVLVGSTVLLWLGA